MYKRFNQDKQYLDDDDWGLFIYTENMKYTNEDLMSRKNIIPYKNHMKYTKHNIDIEDIDNEYNYYFENQADRDNYDIIEKDVIKKDKIFYLINYCSGVSFTVILTYLVFFIL
jgi:hypothetical protein